MNIKTAEFLSSSAKVNQCPETHAPEYAFIGRSNVGKSSLINMLCNNKGLAKVSATPGKTQLINHFNINNGEWYLVDLPGYGYAKVPLGEKARFQSAITDYALKREQLAMFFVLVDVRHPLQLVDKDFMEFLGLKQIPFAIVFTKADKLKQNQVEANMAKYRQEMLKSWKELPAMILTSAHKHQGRELILALIENVNAKLANNRATGNKAPGTSAPAAAATETPVTPVADKPEEA